MSQDKAEAELADLRKAETANKNNFEMLKQSLEMQLAADNKSMEEEKSTRSAPNKGDKEINRSYFTTHT